MDDQPQALQSELFGFFFFSFSLIGKQCFALYAYEAQNEGDLTVTEQEVVTVMNASDKDWVGVENEMGMISFSLIYKLDPIS